MKKDIIAAVCSFASFMFGYIMGRRDGKKYFLENLVDKFIIEVQELGKAGKDANGIYYFSRTEDKEEPSENRD